MKTDQDLAKLFAALGHPSRMAVLRALLARAGRGIGFGELVECCKMPASTLGFHLREMEAAGILSRLPVGRSTEVSLRLEVLLAVVADLTALCCCDGAQDLDNKGAVRA